MNPHDLDRFEYEAATLRKQERIGMVIALTIVIAWAILAMIGAVALANYFF